MSAGHQLKKVREAIRLDNWMVGKKRIVNGVVYASRKDARMARSLIKALAEGAENGRKKAHSSPP